MGRIAVAVLDAEQPLIGRADLTQTTLGILRKLGRNLARIARGLLDHGRLDIVQRRVQKLGTHAVVFTGNGDTLFAQFGQPPHRLQHAVDVPGIHSDGNVACVTQILGRGIAITLGTPIHDGRWRRRDLLLREPRFMKEGRHEPTLPVEGRIQALQIIVSRIEADRPDDRVRCDLTLGKPLDRHRALGRLETHHRVCQLIAEDGKAQREQHAKHHGARRSAIRFFMHVHFLRSHGRQHRGVAHPPPRFRQPFGLRWQCILDQRHPTREQSVAPTG